MERRRAARYSIVAVSIGDGWSGDGWVAVTWGWMVVVAVTKLQAHYVRLLSALRHTTFPFAPFAPNIPALARPALSAPSLRSLDSRL